MITPKSYSKKSDGSFGKAVKDLIYSRDQGKCSRCGAVAEFEYHHRKPRQMGGTSNPEIGQASNGVLLCQECHRAVEARPFLGKLTGFLISGNGIAKPTEVPIFHALFGWVLLDDSGGFEPTHERPE
ncbi:MAG: HNH endonuclease [Microbacteriaceae bacterium]